MKPKLSVLCLTYNHERFIRQTLDGFVMQKTNFPFEVLVHDDASMDETADIIREYEKKYPDIIKPIYQKENQFSKSVSIMKKFLFPLIEGEYVAFCEGDDYWTDENKLQKQVDFLDTHPDFSTCFHPVQVIWDNNSEMEAVFFPIPKWRWYKEVFSFEDVVERYFIQTNSIVYRWRLKGKEDLLPDGILPEDHFLLLLHAQVGKIAYLQDVMAVYRRHQGGIWMGANETDDWFLKYSIPNLAYHRAIETQFNHDEKKEMIDLAAKAILVFMKHEQFEKMQEVEKLYPEIYKTAFEKVCDKIF